MPGEIDRIFDQLNSPIECGLGAAFAMMRRLPGDPAQRNADAWAAEQDRLKIEALRKANEEGVLGQVLRGEK